MKSAIRQRAFELGFDDCRFTTAAPVELASHLHNWLEQGWHGQMTYLARTAEKRANPQLLLPGARTVITLAASYADPPPPDTPAKSIGSFAHHHTAGAGLARPIGLIARYAQFEDYHAVLAGPLKELAQFVCRLGGVGTRAVWYVDTGPVLERALAQRAGLGFVGKHTNLVSRRLGNWFFLAELVTSLELEPDEPAKNRCGKCTRCICACPTGAIVAPFKLDARRCISYLTIENKDAIPAEFRPLIGKRIFGCDSCLAACPWNRFARPGTLMQKHKRANLDTPDLIELLALRQAEFDQKFGTTPIARAKLTGLLRNVCVALGNVGDDSAVPALARLAEGTDTLVAEHARWAIAQIRSRMGAVDSGGPVTH